MVVVKNQNRFRNANVCSGGKNALFLFLRKITVLMCLQTKENNLLKTYILQQTQYLGKSINRPKELRAKNNNKFTKK